MITTGDHVWDQKDIMNFIDNENRLLRPQNLFEPAPGKGFEIYNIRNNIKSWCFKFNGKCIYEKM